MCSSILETTWFKYANFVEQLYLYETISWTVDDISKMSALTIIASSLEIGTREGIMLFASTNDCPKLFVGDSGLPAGWGFGVWVCVGAETWDCLDGDEEDEDVWGDENGF